MTVENSSNIQSHYPIEILALIQIGRITRESLGWENQVIIDYYFGLMAEDPKFADVVNARKNLLNSLGGHKKELFSDGDLIRTKKHRKPNVGSDIRATQPSLLPNEPQAPDYTHDVFDPEEKITKVNRNIDNRFMHQADKIIGAEIRNKKQKLRNMIGLPIARGKNRHIKDPFYKFLVKKICTFDELGIFREHDRVITEIPEELNLKIGQVKTLIETLLNGGLNLTQRYNTYREFVQSFKKE